MAKMSKAQDDAYDRKRGIKEGSKKDNALDKKRGLAIVIAVGKAKKK